MKTERNLITPGLIETKPHLGCYNPKWYKELIKECMKLLRVLADLLICHWPPKQSKNSQQCNMQYFSANKARTHTVYTLYATQGKHLSKLKVNQYKKLLRIHRMLYLQCSSFHGIFNWGIRTYRVTYRVSVQMWQLIQKNKCSLNYIQFMYICMYVHSTVSNK